MVSADPFRFTVLSVEALREEEALPPLPSFARASALPLPLVTAPFVRFARAVVDVAGVVLAAAAAPLGSSGGCFSATFRVERGFLGVVGEGVVVDAVDIVDLTEWMDGARFVAGLWVNLLSGSGGNCFAPTPEAFAGGEATFECVVRTLTFDIVDAVDVLLGLVDIGRRCTSAAVLKEAASLVPEFGRSAVLKLARLFAALDGGRRVVVIVDGLPPAPTLGLRIVDA
jgi:hypothetical protein